MSREYSLSRVRDALDSAKGNKAEAQRIVTGWLEKDQSLMVGLVAPHLKSIVSHAVDYVDGQSRVEDQKPEETEMLSRPSPEGDATGANILETLLGQSKGSGGPQFGNFDEPATRPGKASEKHVKAIHAIARKKKPKKDGKNKE